MFNLEKSFAKIKSFVEENGLQKEPKKSGENDQPKKKKNKPSRTSTKPSTPENIANAKRGIILIKNFPHGFYEKEMFGYFSQFGEVTRLKIMRSSKTGKPKHYGFVEFRFENVAKIAAETMNNYLMFDHLIKCAFIPEEKISSNIFKNWDRPFLSSVEKHKKSHNEPKTAEQELRTRRKILKRLQKQTEILQQKQINFQCVVVSNDNLSKTATKVFEKSATDEPKAQVAQPDRFSKMPTEIIYVRRPHGTTKSKSSKRKILIFPKFYKLKAALRV